MTVNVIEGQSLIDIAVREFGTPLLSIEFAIANNISITDDLFPGQKLNLIQSELINVDLANYFKNKKQNIATALSSDLAIALQNKGIGTMIIGNNFQVG
ncbi:MAG: LysM domain-containing protein [Flavobacterium sp.]|uniref:LysM peptidoglycan-binding domain-containing protein n=1 Tax=Flavobacterium sp. TaxID=239 RepID=UPI0032634A47